MREFKLFLAGEWVGTKSGTVIDDINPATGTVMAKVHTAGPAEIETAIAAAAAAQKSWALLPGPEKKEVFYKAAAYLDKHIDRFMDLLIDESGSPYMKAFAELDDCKAIFLEGAKTVDLVTGKVLHTDTSNQHSYFIRQPRGVVGAIAPFNYPVALALFKITYGLACGNTVILKPSSATPVSGAVIAEILEAAGLPKGVFSVVPGPGGIVGEALVRDSRVNMIAFTGSAATGAEIARGCAPVFKKYALELGGKNPLIVLADYDVDKAVSIAVLGSFWHAGQVCMATSRIIVEAPLYDAFCRKLTESAKALKMGDPRDKDTFIGPLINHTHYKLLDSMISDAVDKGAELLCGGGHHGAYYEPTVLSGVTPEMTIFHEECFGPVTAVIKAENWHEALTLCNDSKYGLTSSLLTNDMAKTLTMAPLMESGAVHVNSPTFTLNKYSPFGGVKNSGVGRELGPEYSVEEYTETKWITIDFEPPHIPGDLRTDATERN